MLDQLGHARSRGKPAFNAILAVLVGALTSTSVLCALRNTSKFGDHDAFWYFASNGKE